jgi:hypothetical protein
MEEALMLSPELRDVLAKVAVFLLVQGLVYIILRESSDVFSKDKTLRSLSFRPMRSMSVRRVLAPLSDVPVGTDDRRGGLGATFAVKLFEIVVVAPLG